MHKHKYERNLGPSKQGNKENLGSITLPIQGLSPMGALLSLVIFFFKAIVIQPPPVVLCAYVLKENKPFQTCLVFLRYSCKSYSFNYAFELGRNVRVSHI